MDKRSDRFVPISATQPGDEIEVWSIQDTERDQLIGPLYGSLERAQRDCSFLNEGHRDLWGVDLRSLDRDEQLDPIQRILKTAKGY